MSRRKNDLSQRLEAVIKTLVPQQEQNPDDLGPMMRAIKAVHSISDHTSTTPEDLERRGGAVCAARHAGHRHPQRQPDSGEHPRRVGQPGARP